MEVTKEHIRHIMLYEFKKGNNATRAAKNICEVYGQSTISESQVQRWFQKFRLGNFSLLDEPRSWGPVEFDEDLLRSIVEQNPNVTVEELSETLGSTHSTIHRHLKNIGKVSKYGQWVPHELSAANLQARVLTCISLLSRLKNEPFLGRIVTGDEKWVLYSNVKRRRQWVDKDQTPNPTAKAGLHNARPHTARETLQKLEDFGWEIMPHPPYSPDIAPSDYHLFRSLQNHLDRKVLSSIDEVREELDNFFQSKPKSFYASGIQKLEERWKNVVENEGKYILD